MTETIVMSKDFQVAIPKEIREARGWRAGQAFVVVADGDGLRLSPAPEITIESLRGIARGANTEGYRDRNDRY